MTDYLVDDEAQELFPELGVEVRIRRQFAQPLDLASFPIGIGRRERDLGLVLTHGLRDAEAFGQHVNERRIDIVDALAIGRENWV